MGGFLWKNIYDHAHSMLMAKNLFYLHDIFILIACLLLIMSYFQVSLTSTFLMGYFGWGGILVFSAEGVYTPPQKIRKFELTFFYLIVN